MKTKEKTIRLHFNNIHVITFKPTAYGVYPTEVTRKTEDKQN